MQKVITQLGSAATVPASLNSSLQKVLAATASGFPQIPKRPVLFEASQKLASELSATYEQFVIIGIGGSSMGARALVELSGVDHILFLDNVDAAEFKRLWKLIEKAPRKTGFIFVSKSGSTIEILWNYSLLEKQLQQLDLELIAQSYFVTEATNSPLAELARKHARPLLDVPLDIGGRFSVLTPVGLVIAALCGFSLSDLKAGAAAAVSDETAVTQASALFLESFKRKEIISLFWFYNSSYRWFGAWLQQLWAESLGKKEDLNGKPAPDFSTPMTAIGACDQHSILQQVAHGTKNKFVCFYNFSSVENSAYVMKDFSFTGFDFAENKNYGKLIASQSLATQQALSQNGVSTAAFHILDENLSYSLGYLFMYFQLVVATIGVHENINPFDQPGVALGKELALKKLKAD